MLDKLGNFLLGLVVKQHIASLFLKCSVEGYDKRNISANTTSCLQT